MLELTNKIICLVGESGSGKTTLYESLREKGYKVVDSFTTRAPRHENEAGHTFVSSEEFDAIRSDLVAYTKFNGFEYGTTFQQIKECDFYIIDPAGVNYLAEKIGRDKFSVVYIYCNEKIRFDRMETDRGTDSAIKRIHHDRLKFRKFIENEDFDYIIFNNFPDLLEKNVERLENIYHRSNNMEV